MYTKLNNRLIIDLVRSHNQVLTFNEFEELLKIHAPELAEEYGVNYRQKVRVKLFYSRKCGYIIERTISRNFDVARTKVFGLQEWLDENQNFKFEFIVNKIRQLSRYYNSNEKWT